MFSFILDETQCDQCGVDLRGRNTIKVNGALCSVSEIGRVVETDMDDTDLVLDRPAPLIECRQCGSCLVFDETEE